MRALNHNDRVQMVWHDNEGIEADVGVVAGQSLQMGARGRTKL